MSPLLQGTVACCANRPWLERIWFLKDMDTTREERDVCIQATAPIEDTHTARIRLFHAFALSSRATPLSRAVPLSLACGAQFVADLSMKLVVAAFIADERMPLGQLYARRPPSPPPRDDVAPSSLLTTP